MFSRKTFISWIVSSVIMFSLSYLWHGVILNDFDKVSYPKELFLSLLAFLYFIIGLIIALAYTFWGDGKKFLYKGLLIGGLTGSIIFLIVFVLGISFHEKVLFNHAVIDFCWQVIEQGTGGAAAGFIYSLIVRREQLMHQ